MMEESRKKGKNTPPPLRRIKSAIAINYIGWINKITKFSGRMVLFETGYREKLRISGDGSKASRRPEKEQKQSVGNSFSLARYIAHITCTLLANSSLHLYLSHIRTRSPHYSRIYWNNLSSCNTSCLSYLPHE